MSLAKTKSYSKFLWLLILAGIIIYSNTLNVPFYFDDQINIANPALRMDNFSVENVLVAGLEGTMKSRPVSNISFSINYLIDGFNVAGYHVFNILIHILAAIFLYFLLQTTLSLPSNINRYGHFPLLAFFTAMLWLVHPLATQSVTYIVQRMNSMAAMFFILSLLLYARGRVMQIESAPDRHKLQEWLWFSGCGVSGLLALGSKEIAATLPVIIFLYEWYFFQDLRAKWLKKNAYWLLGAVLILGTAAYIYTGGHPIRRVFQSCGSRDFSTCERVLTQFRIIVHYMGLILYPNPGRLTFDYNVSHSTSFFTPITTLYSLGALISLLVCAIVLARRERLLSFCILWFFVTLAMESSVICLELVFEHRTYLPSMFFLLFFTALISRFARSNILVASLFTTIVVLFGFWAFERNKVWQDPVTFWSDSLQKSPGKPRINVNLGNAWYKKNNLDQAEKNYQQALAIKPGFPKAFYNLGLVYFKRGDYHKAVEYFLEAIKNHSNYVAAYNNLGAVLLEMNRVEDAIGAFRQAIYIVPLFYSTNKNLGHALLRQGRFRESLFFLNNALEKNPESRNILLDMGKVYQALGNKREAEAIYRHILQIDPEFAPAHYNLALYLAETASTNEVFYHYRQAVRLDPTFIPAVYNYANYLFRQGRIEEASLYYKKIIEITPEYAGALNNYGLILAQKGLYEQAAQFFETAWKIMPDNRQFEKNLLQARKDLANKK